MLLIALLRNQPKFQLSFLILQVTLSCAEVFEKGYSYYKVPGISQKRQAVALQSILTLSDEQVLVQDLFLVFTDILLAD